MTASVCVSNESEAQRGGAVGDSKHACLAWMYAVASEAVHARVSEDVVVGFGVCNDAKS